MSGPELPIACTLSPEEMPARLERMRALGEGLEGVDLDGVRASLRFPAGEEPAVRALVAAEQGCCAWLAYDVSVSPDGSVLLAVEGPAGSEPAVAEWVSAFTAR